MTPSLKSQIYSELQHTAKNVVYGIHIGDKVYIGFSSSFKSRMGIHKSYLGNILKNGKSYEGGAYQNFLYEDLIKYGYTFSIFKQTNNEIVAKKLEVKLIRSTKTGLLNLIKYNNTATKLKFNVSNNDKKGRNPVPALEKKKPMTFFVKDKHYDKAKKEVQPIINKFNNLN